MITSTANLLRETSQLWWLLPHCSRISTTAVCHKRSVGRLIPTKYMTTPLTYEQTEKPDQIGVRKSWRSWHTQNLIGFKQNQPLMVVQDEIIRRFMHGTWATLCPDEFIIKRRGNLIIVAGFVLRSYFTASKMYWLIGYSEELLSLLLKQPVRLELQTIRHRDNLVFRYI